MSEFKCPIESCGRVLESANVLKEHLRRRHPTVNAETGAGEDDRAMQEEVNKLPKIRTLKLQAGQHKLPDIHRRSSSKGKQDNSAINTSKMTSVISESRSFVESGENLAKTAKRPSLNKKAPSNNNSDRHQKLPELKPIGKPKKLQIFNEPIKLKKAESDEVEQSIQNIMYSTAPNFKKLEKKESKIRERSGSKEKIDNTMIEVEQASKKVVQNDLLLIRTQQGFHEKEVKMHKTLRRPSDKTGDHNANISTVVESKQRVDKVKQQPAKEKQKQSKSTEVIHDIKAKTRRQASLRRGQSKQEAASPTTHNFEERIIVFDASVGPKLTIPSTAKVEFIYANNCKLSFVSLGGVQFLRQISLQHNLLKDLSFLNYPANGNIQKLYVDHNQLTTVDYLPLSLKVFSAAFNNISGLDICSRQLSKGSTLQQVDFSFNPIRKESNYKLHLLSACPQLKKVDGMKITKFDLELASEYSKMLDEELGLIPSSKSKDLIISRCSQSPSTMVSGGEQGEPQEGSQQELTKEITKLQKAIKSTRDHLGIIRKQNQIIQSEISQLNDEDDTQGDFSALYTKLRAQCAALELLNFMQWADQQQLLELIAKKKLEVAVS